MPTLTSMTNTSRCLTLFNSGLNDCWWRPVRRRMPAVPRPFHCGVRMLPGGSIPSVADRTTLLMKQSGGDFSGRSNPLLLSGTVPQGSSSAGTHPGAVYPPTQKLGADKKTRPIRIWGRPDSGGRRQTWCLAPAQPRYAPTLQQTLLLGRPFQNFPAFGNSRMHTVAGLRLEDGFPLGVGAVH